MIAAAGVLFRAPDGRVLLLRRAGDGDHAGEWALPGGGIEAGETPEEAAEREVREEIGAAPHGALRLWTRRIKDGVDFTTFAADVAAPFDPTLNDEHDGAVWTLPANAPAPLHPGVVVALARGDMDELGIARAMAAGDLASPQVYGGFFLWKIRITGTGIAWRGAHKDESGKIIREKEFCWRDSSIYLAPDFLARCNGLPVTLIHSEGRTNSEEWSRRAVGTIFLPFVEADECWAIAKVYDESANVILLQGPFSTSPAVFFFGATTAGTKLTLRDGTKLLIENIPALLDAIVLVPAGVWDKGGPATGVQNDLLPSPTTEEPVVMAEETTTEGRDDAALNTKLDAILDSLKGAHSRMDAMDAARKDAATAEEEEKAAREAMEKGEEEARTRQDAARKDRFAPRHDAETDEAHRARMDADEAAMCDALEKGGEDHDKAMDAAKRARKDAETEEEKRALEKANEAREDKARKDAEAARADSAGADALKRQVEDLQRMVRGLTTETPVAERDALARAQARADGIAGLFGERALPPMLGEGSVAYRKRVLASFQKHSQRLGTFDLARLDATSLVPIEDLILADAADAARSPGRAAPGILIPITTREGGRDVTRFTGDISAFMAPFMSGATVGRILRPAKN